MKRILVFILAAGIAASMKLYAVNVPVEPSASEIMDSLVRASPMERKEQQAILYEEAQLLMRIAMAEAESEGIEGKALVMAVVLNRVRSKAFPDTVEEVIFQPEQFSPIKDKRFDAAEPDWECHLALAEIEKGSYDECEALYFDSAPESWQSKNCTYLFSSGNHKFYK